MDVRRYIILFLFVAFCSVCAAQDGLLFKSHQVSKEARTSASVGVDKEIRFRNYFDFSFRYKFYDNPSGCFGSICKIVIGDSHTLDMKLNVRYKLGFSLTFLLNGRSLVDIPLTKHDLSSVDWNTVSFTYLPDESLMTIRNNSDSLLVKMENTGSRGLKVYFGADDVNSSRDVAAFVLGEVKLSLKPGKIKHQWTMDKSCGDIVDDRLGNREMYVENPEWLRSSHMHWKKEASYDFPIFHIASSDNGNVYLVMSDAVCVYSPDTKKMVKYVNDSSFDVDWTSNHFFWNEEKSRLEYVSVTDSTFDFSFFDVGQRRWCPEIVPDGKWNMKGNVMGIGDRNVQMFGYGYHKYSGKIFVRDSTGLRNLNENQKIFPRYLSSAGIFGDNAFVLSGVGNEQGNQLADTRIYADMFKVDLDTGNIERMDLAGIPDDEVAVKNLVDVGEPHSLYTLFYPPFRDNSYLVLKKIDLKEHSIVNYGDTLAFRFHDVESDAILCFSESSQKLYVATREKKDSRTFLLNVWSIRYPVLKALPVNAKPQKRFFVPVLAVVLLSVLFIVFAVIWRRFRSPGMSCEENTKEEVSLTDEDYMIGNTAIDTGSLSSGIHLLGGFRVIAQNGEDITSGFTPVMKWLLSLIILYTLKDDRGVSNSVLKENLWPDKSDESAVNNRSVNIRKIRRQLSGVGEYEIKSKNSYWNIVFSESFRCDIFDAKEIIDGIVSKKARITRNEIFEILKISSQGVLLPNQQNDFFDEFKADWASYVIDALNLCLKCCDEPALRLSVANTIFIFSPLDEFALGVKCRALLALGKNGLAKQAFDTFVRNYKEVMGENFQYSMDYVLNHSEL